MRIRPDGRPPVRRPLRATIAILGIAAVAVAACSSGPSGPTPRVLPDLTAGPTASTAATTPAITPSPAGSPEAVVVVDRGLLSYLPITGQGLVLAVDPDTAAQVAQDPSLRANASALIIAMYTPTPGSTSAAPADDLAVVSVVRLRDPSVGEAWFRDWRDSYDAAACANAGGVARNAEAVIGGHTVFIGSCAGGSFTYHTRVAAGAIVISATSVGPARLGETVMERLAP